MHVFSIERSNIIGGSVFSFFLGSSHSRSNKEATVRTTGLSRGREMAGVSREMASSFNTVSGSLLRDNDLY